jgi:hypothetical protein
MRAALLVLLALVGCSESFKPRNESDSGITFTLPADGSACIGELRDPLSEGCKFDHSCHCYASASDAGAAPETHCFLCESECIANGSDCFAFPTDSYWIQDGGSL